MRHMRFFRAPTGYVTARICTMGLTGEANGAVTWTRAVILMRRLSASHESYTMTEADLTQVGLSMGLPTLNSSVLRRMFAAANISHVGVLTIFDLQAVLNNTSLDNTVRQGWRLLTETLCPGSFGLDAETSAPTDQESYASSTLLKHYHRLGTAAGSQGADALRQPLPKTLQTVLYFLSAEDCPGPVPTLLNVGKPSPKGRRPLTSATSPRPPPSSSSPSTRPAGPGLFPKSPGQSSNPRPLSAKLVTSPSLLDYPPETSPLEARSPKPFGFKDSEKQVRREAAEVERHLRTMLGEQTVECDSLKAQLKTQQKERKQAAQHCSFQLRQLQSENELLQSQLKDATRQNVELRSTVQSLQSALILSEMDRVRHLSHLESSNQELASQQVQVAESKAQVQKLESEYRAEVEGLKVHSEQWLGSLKDKDHQIAQLQSALNELQENYSVLSSQHQQAVAEAEHAMHQLQNVQEVRNMVELAIHNVEGSSKEQKLRATVAHLMQDPHDRQLLLNWANALVAQYTPMQPPLPQLGAAAGSLAPYLAFFNVLAPKHLAAEECQQMLHASSTEQQQCLARVMDSLCVPRFMQPPDLLQAQATQHFLMFSFLFLRFCDPSLGAAHDFLPLAGTFIRQDNKATVADLKRRFVAAQQQQKRWRSVAEKCFWCTIQQSLEEAQKLEEAQTLPSPKSSRSVCWSPMSAGGPT